MLTKEGSCKLTDFGIANQFQAGEKLVSCVGTPCWSKRHNLFLFFLTLLLSSVLLVSIWFFYLSILSFQWRPS